MAEKPVSNFKTAVNELMNGKIKTDEPFYDDGPAAPAASPAPAATSSIFPAFSKPAPVPYSAPAESASSERSVFASDLIIEGTVKSKSDITLAGYIKGDVSCGGAISATGTIDGNIDGTNVILTGSTINGNINVRGSVALDNNSSVTGDIIANTLVSDGRIKGNIILKESIALHSNAIVYGNVKAKNIAIESGTTLVGNIEIKSGAAEPPLTLSSTPAAETPTPSPSPTSEPAPAPAGSSVSELLAKREALKESLAKKDAERDQ